MAVFVTACLVHLVAAHLEWGPAVELTDVFGSNSPAGMGLRDHESGHSYVVVGQSGKIASSLKAVSGMHNAELAKAEFVPLASSVESIVRVAAGSANVAAVANILPLHVAGSLDHICGPGCTGRLQLFPFSKDAMVPSLRLPVASAPAQITLSAELLVQIHSGNVSHWDDDRLVELNGGAGSAYATAIASLSDGTIAVHCTSAASTAMEILRQLAVELGIDWNDGGGCTRVHATCLQAAQAVFVTTGRGAIALVSQSETRMLPLSSGVALMPHLHDNLGSAVVFTEEAATMADLERISVVAPESMVWDGTRWPLIVVEWMVMLKSSAGAGVSGSLAATDCAAWEGLVEDLFYVTDNHGVQELLQATQGLEFASLTQLGLLREASVSAECGGKRALQSNGIVFGAGASFPKALYAVWMLAFGLQHPSAPRLEYSAVGSGSGKRAIVAEQIVFAGSDSALSDEQLQARGDLVMLPSGVGAVVTPVHIELLPGAPTVPLVLSRAAVADIFMGRISRWDDSVIAGLNPALADYLPSAAITVVVRSDKSGTTSIFTAALSSFSPTWASDGPGETSYTDAWAPGSMAQEGNTGVALAVLNTANSIGYVVLDVAIQYEMDMPLLVNKAGNLVAPTLESLSAAAGEAASASASKPALPFVKSVVDSKISNAWPIAGFTYLLVPTRSSQSCEQLKAVLEYYKWTLSSVTAAMLAESIGFAPISDAGLRSAIEKVVDGVTCGGMRLLSPCGVGKYLDASSGECMLCANGTYSSAMTDFMCVGCDAGWVASAGSGSCDICPVDTYTSADGGQCLECPAFSRALQAGSHSIASCACVSGRWRSPVADAMIDELGEIGVGRSSIELCLACPANSECSGGDAPPSTRPGYWASDDDAYTVLRCEPAEVCTGGSQCRAGHTGTMCATCLEGYYTVDGLCVKCPRHVTRRLVVMVMLMVMIMLMPVLTPQHRLMTMQVAPITANFAQVLAALTTLQLRWHPGLAFMMRMLSPVHWINIAAPPECALEQSFYLSWGIRVLLPLAMFGLVLLALFVVLAVRFVAHVMYVCSASVVAGGRLERHCVGVLVLCVFSQTPLEYFNCFKGAGGLWYLQADPSEVCYEGQWMRYLPLAVFVVLTHLVMFPVIMGVALFLARKERRRDSIGFQSFFGFLYLRYTPRYWWWEFVVLMRKLSTFCLAMFLFTSPVLAAALISIVQVVYLVAHVSYVPYIMPGTNMIEVWLCVTVVVFAVFGVFFAPVFDSEGAVKRRTLSGCLGLVLVAAYLFLGMMFVVESLRAWSVVRKRAYHILTRPWRWMRAPTAHTRLVYHRHPDPLINSRVVHARELAPSLATYLEIRDPEAVADFVTPGDDMDAELTANLLHVNNSLLNLFDVHGSLPRPPAGSSVVMTDAESQRTRITTRSPSVKSYQTTYRGASDGASGVEMDDVMSDAQATELQMSGPSFVAVSTSDVPKSSLTRSLPAPERPHNMPSLLRLIDAVSTSDARGTSGGSSTDTDLVSRQIQRVHSAGMTANTVGTWITDPDWFNWRRSGVVQRGRSNIMSSDSHAQIAVARVISIEYSEQLSSSTSSSGEVSPGSDIALVERPNKPISAQARRRISSGDFSMVMTNAELLRMKAPKSPPMTPGTEARSDIGATEVRSASGRTRSLGKPPSGLASRRNTSISNILKAQQRLVPKASSGNSTSSATDSGSDLAGNGADSVSVPRSATESQTPDATHSELPPQSRVQEPSQTRTSSSSSSSSSSLLLSSSTSTSTSSL
ncbi:phosphate ABC transporter [Thecamonas trahens ATCC 50062]|uniref:Phosphate ABC transporter n=1 Tax=Thecamonas trahens ATCC 50062 TaxID=461836 RepID=A0A0L0DMM2_THETB|nr:phosphate ABC transporter [Thecamonas trahens ATCC 50062]KNC53276.1 phosphate ABC transporter [Thecamonas trahens ATCC 50062]|eukprot:XP_013754540.1 phosphate ABC transporter [Thecamonas trahens ATCC 50062]